MKLKINFLIDEQSQKMSAREASYNPQQWHSMGATQNWTFFDTSRINYHKVSKKLCYLKLAYCVPQFPHITLSLIHKGQCVAEKNHWDKPPTLYVYQKIMLLLHIHFCFSKKTN